MGTLILALACCICISCGRRVRSRQQDDTATGSFSMPAIRQSLSNAHARGMQMIRRSRDMMADSSPSSSSFPSHPSFTDTPANHQHRLTHLSSKQSQDASSSNARRTPAMVESSSSSRWLATTVQPFRKMRWPSLKQDWLRLPTLSSVHVPQVLLDARRNTHFFIRATYLFSSYEIFQLQNRLISKCRGDSHEEIEAAWAKQHDWGGRQLYQMAVDLQGFYLKGAQWLSARPDISPPEWVTHLSKLQDRCPPLAQDEVEAVICSELGATMKDIFSQWDDKPIGSASIAQVHRAVLRKRSMWWWPWSRKRVAVKVQRPGAEHTMLCDLRSSRAFFSIPFVRRSLAWDPKVVLDAVYNETSAEFDFVREAQAMDAAADVLQMPARRWLKRFGFYKPPIAIPRSVHGMVTKRLLVMDLLPGDALSNIARKAEEAAPSEPNKLTRRNHVFGKRLLLSLSEASGRMLFEDGFGGVHADPHPGNILLHRKLGGFQIGMVDWGQIKRFDLSMRLHLARMIEALCAAGDDVGRASSDELVAAFRALGVRWNSTLPLQEQHAAVAATATEWFDTVPLPSPYTIDPTSKHYPILALGKLDMDAFPTDLLYFFRTTQYLRAMGDKLGIQWSLAEHWRPHARRLLQQHGYRFDAPAV